MAAPSTEPVKAVRSSFSNAGKHSQTCRKEPLAPTAFTNSTISSSWEQIQQGRLLWRGGNIVDQTSILSAVYSASNRFADLGYQLRRIKNAAPFDYQAFDGAMTSLDCVGCIRREARGRNVRTVVLHLLAPGTWW